MTAKELIAKLMEAPLDNRVSLVMNERGVGIREYEVCITREGTDWHIRQFMGSDFFNESVWLIRLKSTHLYWCEHVKAWTAQSLATRYSEHQVSEMPTLSSDKELVEIPA